MFRVCVSGKFEHSHHGFVRGDMLHYKVFGMMQTDLLKILSAVPIAAAASPTQVSPSDVNPDSPLLNNVNEEESTHVDAVILSTQDESRTETVLPAAEGEETMDLFGEDDPAVAPAGEIDTSEQMWECEVCTLLNAPHLTECAACTSLRPSAASAGETAPAALAGWWCTVCTLINPISERT